MMTRQQIIISNSNNLKDIRDKSVHLIVTSPPYPMIQMWDEIFGSQDPAIFDDLNKGNGLQAFYRMNNILNDVWSECDRVLVDGGFACINIGDATRTINDNFQLYSNHTQIINFFLSKGYSVLPDIHWRKTTNAPNKFMGSGMYPAGAYVTYEHEYILVFRKGAKRIFNNEEKIKRQKSAYFWEERNVWFSDVWDIKGASQVINEKGINRERNASFPLEIPYRLIQMYSIEGDYVLDPFGGLGTTSLAAMLSNRNSYSVDIDESIASLAISNLNVSAENLNKLIDKRINEHNKFISSLSQEKKDNCYYNDKMGIFVKTKQETKIQLSKISSISQEENTYKCEYE